MNTYHVKGINSKACKALESVTRSTWNGGIEVLADTRLDAWDIFERRTGINRAEFQMARMENGFEATAYSPANA